MELLPTVFPIIHIKHIIFDPDLYIVQYLQSDYYRYVEINTPRATVQYCTVLVVEIEFLPSGGFKDLEYYRLQPVA